MAEIIEKIIRPKKMLSWEDAKEIWRYKELLYFFVWRDIKVRYKQTVVGIGWAVFQPFATMVIFSVVFGKLAQIPSDGIPYPIFVYIGLLFWQLFSSALGDASNTLVGNAGLLTKVYFPRLILPFADTANKYVDLFFASLVLGGIMIYYGYAPHLLGFLIAPILLFITTLTAVGAGLFMASINVKYRDVRYVLPFFIQILLFVTPVIYPSSIAGKYAWILNLNPMTGVIKAARGAFLGTAPVNWALLGLSFLASLVIFSIGVFFFKKVERYFADIV